MTSYLGNRPASFFTVLWASGCLFWVVAADPVQSYESGQQAAVSQTSTADEPQFLATEGCPYPDEKQAAQGAAESAPALPPQMRFELRMKPRSPIRPAVFQEFYVPADRTDNPKIRI